MPNKPGYSLNNSFYTSRKRGLGDDTNKDFNSSTRLEIRSNSILPGLLLVPIRIILFSDNYLLYSRYHNLSSSERACNLCINTCFGSSSRRRDSS